MINLSCSFDLYKSGQEIMIMLMVAYYDAFMQARFNVIALSNSTSCCCSDVEALKVTWNGMYHRSSPIALALR
jgi:hypothetical protein